MKQQRNSKQRNLIQNAVTTRNDHPSADDIYLELKKTDPSISRATVYRNLKLLSETGKIQRIKGMNADRYDHRLDHHSHIQCSVCGKIIDVTISYNRQQDETIQQQTGYLIQDHRMIFDGICPDCQKKMK